MNTKALILAAGLASATIAAAFAHGDATGIVKERMDGMMAMGKALSAVGDMFKGKTEFKPEQVGVAADIILSHTTELDKLFPDTQASRKGKGTEALPTIWSDRNGFLAIAAELESRAKELKALAETGDKRKIRIGFAKVAKSCAACHTGYRKPKK